MDPWQLDPSDDGQISSATAAQHRIRAMQRSDITRWETGSQAGHNRPQPAGVPIVDCQENGEWPSPADIVSRKREAEREKERRLQKQARAAAMREETAAQTRTGRTLPDTSWCKAFAEADRARIRAEEARKAQASSSSAKFPPGTPPWVPHLPPDGTSAASQGRNYPQHTSQPRVSSSASTSAGHGISPGTGPSRARPSNQSSYATQILHGNDGAGILHEAFTEAIKRDIAWYSDPRKNQYVLKYLDARAERGEPGKIEFSLNTYDTATVLANSLHEFTLASRGHRDARNTNLSEYSVAILYLVAHSTALFPWTRELLRRHITKADEDNLKFREET